MIDFEDRISAYPNRYIMTDENGNTSYIVLERADEPIKPGTPLNAETFNAMQIEAASADATYTIGDGEYTLQEALIEQASQMKHGEERLVYFHDELPSVFYHGYGIVKLYCHESIEQGKSSYVCAHIYSERKYYMNIVKNDNGTWYCTDMVRDVTSTELANYYTSAQVDGKFVPKGSEGTVGMCLEFDSGNLNTTYYATSGRASKFYTLTLSDGDFCYSLTLDYRHLPQPGKPGATENFTYDSANYYVPIYNAWANATDRMFVEVGVYRYPDDTGKVGFRIGSATDDNLHRIKHVCGYY